MKKSRFKTKLSKEQKRKNILVFFLVVALSYAFVLLFGFAIGIFDGEPLLEIFTSALFLSFFILSMLLFPILLAGVALGLQKGKAKRVRDDATFISVQDIIYYRDSLTGINPALLSLLIDLDIYGTKDIIATLLRMNNKKAIQFQENGSINVTNLNARELDSSELELLKIIKNDRLNDKRALSQWKQNRFQEAETAGYIKKRNEEKRNKIADRYVYVVIFSVFAAFCLWGLFLNSGLVGKMDSVIDAIKAFAALVVIDIFLFVPAYRLLQNVSYSKRGDVVWERTPVGNEMAEKIAGLGRFINEFSRLSEAKKEEVRLWDDYLVYAIVLEENEQIVKDVSKQYHFNLRKFDKLC